jgi:Electron transfer DM13
VEAGRRRTRVIAIALLAMALAAGGPRDRFDDGFLSLGRLKANQGNQNYEIATGTRVDRYRSVVIWCRRFTYAFGAAELVPAR